jgi:hypothetical protein
MASFSDRIFLVEIDGWNADDSAEVTFRYTNKRGGYITKSTDTPAKTQYEERLGEIANFERNMFARAATFGRSQTGVGTVSIFIGNDKDTGLFGDLDFLIDYGFDGREIRIYTLPEPTSSYSEKEVYFIGEIEQAEFEWNKINFIIRDKLYQLELPIQPAKFLGTNSGPTGIEGLPDDIEGQPKPCVYGQVFNISPTFVNTSSLIYACNFDSDGNTKAVDSIDAVYYNGAEISIDTSVGTSGDVADLAALQSATIATVKYATCKDEGLIRLGTNLIGTITADITEGDTAADRTAAQIVKRILDDRTEGGSSTCATATFSALDTANSSVCGIYINSERSVIDCCTEVLQSIGAWMSSCRISGLYRVGRLEAPTGTASRSVIEAEISSSASGGIQRIASADGNNGIPFYRVNLSYKKNYTIMTSGIAGSVQVNDEERLVFLENEYRKVTSEDKSVQIKHLRAEEMDIPTLLVTQANAETEADRQLALRSARRDVIIIRLSDNDIVDIGQIVEIDIPRFDMDGGKKFVVIGQIFDPNNGYIEYTLWG